MKTTIIRNGRIIDPATKRDEIGDLVIADGRIADQSAIRNPQSEILRPSPPPSPLSTGERG